MASIVLQFVDPDGTYMLRGLRVRAAAGSGDVSGTLYDEAPKGIRTPLDSEESRKVILAQVDQRLASFVRSLPAVRMVPRDAIDS